jgi:hypothetical protein
VSTPGPQMHEEAKQGVMRLRDYIWLVLTLSASLAVSANAAPTVIGRCDSPVGFTASAQWDAPVRVDRENTATVELGASHLAMVGDELLRPPVEHLDTVDALPVGTRALPSVPGAILMVLVGFVCISLVKDRKLWLAALVSLLWLGQAGFTVLPQLASQLRGRQQKDCNANVTLTCGPEASFRLRSDLEGTQYIGLLRHLGGIPDGATLSTSLSLVASGSRRCAFKSRPALSTNAPRGGKLNDPSQFAVLQPSGHTIRVDNCLSAVVRQPVCFSPAFVFDVLARGPPEQP